MNCDIARDRLLEAGPAELRGETPSPLARHIRSCPRCAATASRILDDQAMLAAAIDGQPAPRSARDAADAVLAAVGRGHHRREGPEPRAAATAGGADTDHVASIDAAHAARRSRGVPAWLPLALAAGLAALLLVAQWDLTPPGDAPAALDPARDPESTFAVAAPPDRDVALFETSNPDIKVVWLY